MVFFGQEIALFSACVLVGVGNGFADPNRPSACKIGPQHFRHFGLIGHREDRRLRGFCHSVRLQRRGKIGQDELPRFLAVLRRTCLAGDEGRGSVEIEPATR